MAISVVNVNFCEKDSSFKLQEPEGADIISSVFLICFLNV